MWAFFGARGAKTGSNRIITCSLGGIELLYRLDSGSFWPREVISELHGFVSAKLGVLMGHDILEKDCGCA